jgi:RNA polymerase sigma-70 factor (ECF subfamily)
MPQIPVDSRTSEDRLIEGCRRGSEDSRREVYARTVDRVYRLLLRMTQNPETAADLTQDTYLRVFQHVDGFQGASSLSTWIYRIAVNEARQHFRRQALHERVLQQEVGRPECVQAGGQEASGVVMDVREALGRLPEAERTLVVLKYFEGLDYGQMADVLGKPPGTIASGLNRARRMLQELLGDDGEERREDGAGLEHPM